MPEFLALDWESHQLCGVEAQVSKGKVRISNSFVLPWPETFDRAEDPTQAGEWLKGELSRLEIDAKQVLLSLPREDAVVRQLELPNAPDAELPDLVRFQAATKSAMALDQFSLDFLPLPPRPEGDIRDVLMATVPREMIQQTRQLLMAAGLELISMGLSPVATAELISRTQTQRGLDPGDITLVVGRHGERVEITLMRDRHLLFSHSARLLGHDEKQDNQAVLAEINRSVVALERLHVGTTIGQAWVLGTQEESQGLYEALSERLTCDVHAIDPLKDVRGIELATEAPAAQRATFAGPVGILLSQSGEDFDRIDFLDPRQTIVKPDRRKQHAGLAAAGVAAALLVGYVGLQFYLNGLQTEIDELKARNTELRGVVEAGEPVLQSAGQVTAWERENTNWLEQMRIVSGQFPKKDEPDSPTTEYIYLTDYDFVPPRGKDAYARIQATGNAYRREDVNALYDNLADKNYRIYPSDINLKDDDPDYRYQFTLDAELMPAKKKSAKKAAAAKKSNLK